jgi:hypothetical protein
MKKNSSVKKCVCGDEKVTHEFNLQATAFEINKPFKISASAFTLFNETIVCTKQNKKVTKKIRFKDIEVKDLIVEPEGIPKEHVESFFVVFKCNFHKY